MKINRNARPAVFRGENGEQLTLCPSNMGEPFREGIDFTYQDEHDHLGGFFEVSEVASLAHFLGKYLDRERSDLLPRELHDCLSGDELEVYERLSGSPLATLSTDQRNQLAGLDYRISEYRFAMPIPDLSSLQRYTPDVHDAGCMEEDDEGLCVRLQDVKALLAKISMEGGW